MGFSAVRGILDAMEAKEFGGGAPPEDEVDLVRRAREGDRKAFDRLVRLHLPRVWSTVWRMLRHREDTEDVVQDVFVTAYGALAGFRGDARLSTWLHRIAVTRSLHHLEKAETRLRQASDAIDLEARTAPRAIGTPLTTLEAKELLVRLSECLEKLPAAWRMVLALRDAEASSYEQMAETLRVEIGTVRSRLSRARTALKDCVEGRVP